ncbi:MAG: hypothetical protein U0Q21_16185 [Dermatophilaceae bacterium]
MVRAGCPRLPLAYFDQRVVAPIGWASGSNAYLAFVSTYAEELTLAAAVSSARPAGWP